MKKILTAIVLFVFAVLPMSVMAMQAVSDNELSTMTGQAGVSINLDANINLQIGTVAWGDKDGLGTTEASGTGWVGVQSLAANVRVKLRDDLINTALANATNAAVFGATPSYQAAIANFPTAAGTFIATYNATYSTTYDYTTAAAISASLAAMMADTTHDITAVSGYSTFAAAYSAYTTALPYYTAYVAFSTASAAIQPLTIDVATDSGTAHGVAGTTFVRIGLGSIGIYVSSMDGTVALGGGATPTLNQELGSFYLGGLTVLVNKASYVDIYNGRASGQGVTLGLNVVIDSIVLNTLSWGDKDGFVTFEGSPINSQAGYVGLTGTTIAGLQILGPVTVDVATDAAGGKQALYATTFVRIGFDGLNVKMGTLDATAVLGQTKDFSTSAVDTLGSIYLSGLDVTFGSGSRVDIYNYYGKSGVVLDFNATIASIAITTLSWGDSDGVSAGFTTTYTNAGYVGLKNLAITDLALSGIATVDVATVVSGDTSSLLEGTTFVRIGLGNVTIGIGSMDATVALGTTKSNLSQELGTIYLSTMTAVANGTVDIYAPSTTTQGVVLALNVSVSISNIAALSWGDADGIGGVTAAGFVGLKNLALGGLTIAGKVSIDVATVDATATVNSANTLMYHAYYNHLMSTNSQTFVHIGLGTGNAYDAPASTASLAVNLTSMAADIALDSTKTLAGAGLSGSGLLGSVYVGGVQAKINGWVDIAAH